MKKIREWLNSHSPSSILNMRTEKYCDTRKEYQIYSTDTLKATKVHYKRELLKHIINLFCTVIVIFIMYKICKGLFLINSKFPSTIEFGLIWPNGSRLLMLHLLCNIDCYDISEK